MNKLKNLPAFIKSSKIWLVGEGAHFKMGSELIHFLHAVFVCEFLTLTQDSLASFESNVGSHLVSANCWCSKQNSFDVLSKIQGFPHEKNVPNISLLRGICELRRPWNFPLLSRRQTWATSREALVFSNGKMFVLIAQIRDGFVSKNISSSMR